MWVRTSAGSLALPGCTCRGGWSSALSRILRESSPILFVEIHPYHLPRFGTSAPELVSLLTEGGYRVYEIPEIRGFESGRPLRPVHRNNAPRENAMLLATRGDLPEGIQ